MASGREEIVGEPLLVAATSLAIERAAAEAVATLRDAGIRAILVKGPPQQEWLAPAGAPRASTDVDVLVDPDAADAAGRVFAEIGYRSVLEVTPGVGHHASVWAAPGRVSVDVHDRLWGAEGGTWEVLAQETESVTIAGETVEVPNEAARCLVVALHAAHHGVGKDATLYDLERAIVVAEPPSWERAAELARRIGAEVAFAAGLGLVSSGERRRAELGLEEPSLTGGVALDIATPSSGAAGYYWLSRQRGLRARARFVARKIVPPADFMRFKHPSARQGRAHLLLVYLYRPLWLARWAIPGFLEWRRIRSAAETDRVVTRPASRRQSRLTATIARALLLTRALDWVYRTADRTRSEMVSALASDAVLDRFNDIAYASTGSYRPDSPAFRAYLFPWEEEAIRSYFPRPPAHVLVGGAGGGREALALVSRGYRVTAFEPSLELFRVLAGQSRKVEGLTVYRARYEDLPNLEGAAQESIDLAALPAIDAVIAGWGSFSHLRKHEQRVATLEALAAATTGPILVSFLGLYDDASTSASLLGRLRRALPRRTGRGLGDAFSVSIGFYHRTNERELSALAGAAGLEVVYASFDMRDTNWPHVVLRRS